MFDLIGTSFARQFLDILETQLCINSRDVSIEVEKCFCFECISRYLYTVLPLDQSQLISVDILRWYLLLRDRQLLGNRKKLKILFNLYLYNNVYGVSTDIKCDKCIKTNVKNDIMFASSKMLQ